MPEHDYDYERLSAMVGRGKGRTVRDVIALSPGNDPFYLMPARVREGEWFVELWQRFHRPGLHLRGFHYLLITQLVHPLKPDGESYENTKGDWMLLNDGARVARYLGLIDPQVVPDHRTPSPRLYVQQRVYPAEPSYNLEQPQVGMPFIPQWSLSPTTFDLPTPTISGYDYTPADQPMLLEVWVEKSGMDTVLAPVCEAFGANLVTGIGYLSITAVRDMLARLVQHAKPCRILYISDFDPSGEGMPIQVARQAEFWLPGYEIDPDVRLKLKPIALLPDQIARLNLPRAPIKDTDRSRVRFETQHGAGAVELDALEALFPGELARLVRAELEPYVDRNLPRRLYTAQTVADDQLQTAWDDVTAPYASMLEDLADQVNTVTSAYVERLRILGQQLDAELAPYAQRLREIRQSIVEVAEDFEPELPERPEPELDEVDESEWLYDSSRDYFEQMPFYKQHRQGGAAAEPD